MARFEDLKAGIEKRLGSEPFRRNDASFIEKFFSKMLKCRFYEGTSFREGHRVRYRCVAGTEKSEDTGYPRELIAGPTQKGTIYSFQPRGDGQFLVNVEWDAQEWEIYDENVSPDDAHVPLEKVKIEKFISSTHPDYLIKI